MTGGEYRAILSRYLPQAAVDGIYAILDSNRVFLHITRERKSKLGDYRWPRRGHNFHEISVNGDLNRYFFLYVLLHEVAHMDAFLSQGVTHEPHGHFWQQCYRKRLVEFAACFTPDVAVLINAYCSRIPLSRTIGSRVEAQLRTYDKGYAATQHVTLDQLPAGTFFRVIAKPAIRFRSVERQRTRWRCLDVASGRVYTVSGRAEVEVCDNE